MLALWLGGLALFVLPAAALAAGSLYVANVAGTTSVSQFAIGPVGMLSPLTPPMVAAGANPYAIAISPDGRSAYVTAPTGYSDRNGRVLQYSVDPATGSLSPDVPASVASGIGPNGVAVTPDGKSAYVTDSSGVSQYDIDPVTGDLSPKIPATVAAGVSPQQVAVSHHGKNAYVISYNGASPTISQYSIDPNSGALSPMTPATVATGVAPSAVVVGPDDKSVYVATESATAAGRLYQYNVDAAGLLTPKTPAFVDVGLEPVALAITPDGRSVYVSNLLGNAVSQENVDPLTGALSPKNPATVSIGEPTGIAVTSDGKSAYVASVGGDIVQYDIDPSSGTLSQVPTNVIAGSEPFDIAIGRFPLAQHATSTSVICSPGTFAPGDGAACTATVSDTNAGRASTPTGSVKFTSSGLGGFFGSPCPLSGSGASASCGVFLAALTPGWQAITARYGGDAAHTTSTGVTLVSVKVPASTDGCLVFEHGRITAANGDRASFRGLTVASPPRGAEFYRDSGPANPFRLVSTSVDALTCGSDASRASVFGKATVNGSESVEYRIDIQLAAWESGRDTYRIRLSNGYDSGAQPIRHGNVGIQLRESHHRHQDSNADHLKVAAGQDGG